MRIGARMILGREQILEIAIWQIADETMFASQARESRRWWECARVVSVCGRREGVWIARRRSEVEVTLVSRGPRRVRHAGSTFRSIARWRASGTLVGAHARSSRGGEHGPSRVSPDLDVWESFLGTHHAGGGNCVRCLRLLTRGA